MTRKQERKLDEAQRRQQEGQASEIMNSRQIRCSQLNKYVSLNSKNKQQLEHFSDHFDILQKQCDKLQKELRQCKQQKLSAERKHHDQIAHMQ